MIYEKKHEDFLKKIGFKLYDLQCLNADEKNHFIADHLISYICGDGTDEEETVADDIITMITSWKPGQLTDEGGKHMDKHTLREIAKETIDITDKMCYRLPDGEKVDISTYDDYADVKVYSPEMLREIEDDDNEFFERAFCGTNGAAYYVVEGDSFEAAKGLPSVLVMNFANAHTPGGGFLNGARAQEESLCRCSTLYKSISSDAAKEMYDFNNKIHAPLDSDYMLLSENVCVFRDPDYELLSEPYYVGVVTVPAPNRNGRAASVPDGEIYLCMKNRLRKMFFMAAKDGYRSLVLGAWGCGAFGNDTREVAKIFHELFFDEGFDEFFEVVCFAIKNDRDKVAVFTDVFADHILDEDYEDFLYGYSDDEEEDDEEPLKFYCADSDAPVLNHSLYVTKNNLGYMTGVIWDGTPFEAEYFISGDDKTIAIYIPVFEEKNIEENKDSEFKPGLAGFRYEDEATDNSIMDIGMVDGGVENDDEIIHSYVNYVVDSGLIKFASDMRNGYVVYRTDTRGNEYAKIMITLSENDHVNAYSLMGIRPFENMPETKTGGQVVQFKKN